MTTTLVADDASAVSATPESLTSPPGEEQIHSMEVDDGDDSQPPVSPISHREDNLLTGRDAVGVEGEMANITVSSPGGGDDGEEGARPFPSVRTPPTYLGEALLVNASRMSMWKGPEPLHWKS